MFVKNPRSSSEFLSLFQQGKDLKMNYTDLQKLYAGQLVSIPFSAGQRLKEYCPEKLDPEKFNWKFLSLFQQGKDLKSSVSGSKYIGGLSFYPFFSRAKT